MRVAYKISFIFFIFFIFYSCSPTKYVGKDEYLLDRVKVKVDDYKLNRSDLKRNIRQKPNTRILGVARFHLGLYNLSGRNEKKKFNQWLRRIGEAPVIYDPFMTQRSASQIELYLHNKGFYSAEVSDTIFYKKRKAFVEYHVKVGPVTRIQEVRFDDKEGGRVNQIAEESGLMANFRRDTVNTLLEKDAPLDLDVLDDERERITKMLREKGYFNFSKNFIQFFADTTSAAKENMAKVFVRVVENAVDSNAYRRYFVRNISVNFDYDPMLTAEQVDSTYNTLYYNGYNILYKGKLKIKPKMIIETIQLQQMELYDARRVIDTYVRLQALNLFKMVNIDFKEVESDGDVKALDCVIQLSPVKRQSYNVFLEGTHNSGNMGVGGNFTYNHRNVFRAGENISASIWGSLRKEQVNGEGKIFNTSEIGAELKLVTPQFWMPFFKMKDFRRNYAPKTSISFSYSYEYTPYYTRSIANARFGYLWRKANKKWRYNFDLIDLNYVLMKDVDQNFIDGLKNEYIKSAYTNHMILSANFSAVFTDQVVNSAQSFNYFRGNLETSGNFLLAMDKLLRARKSGSEEERFYKILGVRYAQFIKADGEYRFNHYLNKANSVVYRLFLGCGYPYGNMKALPFEEAYYCGGANDIRAWQARTLGPGSYAPPDKYPNNVGDFKLEANVEYRFKLFWLLEGALFIDAGNIWNINRYENRQGTKLSSGFYKQIAVGTGAGLRLDVNFFLLRFDLGLKLHDPMQAEGQRFVLLNRNGGFNKSVFNIAIGYPF